MNKKSVCIIGSGPGGYVAAIRAAQLGLEVKVIEQGKAGGVCLNQGCIPTKALLRSAEVLELAKQAKEFGITLDNPSYDWKTVMRRKSRIVGRLSGGVSYLLKKNNVELVKGSATFVSDKEISISDDKGGQQHLSADAFIIATGAVPASLPIEHDSQTALLNSNDLLELESVPESLILIGGGVIGIEFACLFSAFGSNVHIVEYLPGILGDIDREIADTLQKMLEKRGIKVSTSSAVKSVKDSTEGLSAIVEDRCDQSTEAIHAACVAVTAGRIPNVGRLELDKAGISFSQKGIDCNERMETSAPNIFAIGDVVGKYQLAHTASHEGIIAAENIAGLSSAMDYKAIPACVYSTPEIAIIGFTEEQATDKGIATQTGKFPFSANGRAMTFGGAEGFVKVVADKNSNKLIGLHMIGPHVSELLPEGAISLTKELDLENIANSIHAHPTFSESISEAALAALGRGINF